MRFDSVPDPSGRRHKRVSPTSSVVCKHRVVRERAAFSVTGGRFASPVVHNGGIATRRSACTFFRILAYLDLAEFKHFLPRKVICTPPSSLHSHGAARVSTGDER